MERRRREDRGAEGAEKSGVRVSPPHWRRKPSSQKIFRFCPQKASFGALWLLFFAVKLNGNWLRPLSGMH